MDRQGQCRTGNHDQVAQTELPDFAIQQAFPHFHPQRKSGVLDVPEHGGDDHDKESDPEEGEEAAEVVVVAFRIEVGHTGNIIDRVEETVARSKLFPCGGYGVCGRGRIFRDRGRAATVVDSKRQQL